MALSLYLLTDFLAAVAMSAGESRSTSKVCPRSSVSSHGGMATHQSRYSRTNGFIPLQGGVLADGLEGRREAASEDIRGQPLFRSRGGPVYDRQHMGLKPWVSSAAAAVDSIPSKVDVFATGTRRSGTADRPPGLHKC